MGWKQPMTPIQTDNTTAAGVVNNTIIPKRSKSMDLRFWWLKCREAQQQFRFYWAPGRNNWGDYSTNITLQYTMSQIEQDVLESSPLVSNSSRNPPTEYDSILKSKHRNVQERHKACSQEVYSLFGYSKGVLLLYLHSVTLACALSQQS